MSALSFTVWRDSAACFLSSIVILIPIDGAVDGRAMRKCVRTGRLRRNLWPQIVAQDAEEADRNRKERLSMAYGAFADTKSRYRDLEVLVDYREYDGEWTHMVRGELVKAAAQSAGIHACPVLRWKDVRVRRELSGARLRVGKARGVTRGVLRVRVRDAVPQRRC